MDPSQLKQIVEESLRDPRNVPAIAYGMILVMLAAGAVFGAYLKAKGTNIAQKEDLKKLTELVESVRSQHAERLEKLAHENRKALEFGTREHQLRLAALDRRLETHQQAYTLWRKLVSSVYTEHKCDVVIECQTWWNQNCLYLDSDAREAFVRAYQAANFHSDILRSKTTMEEVKDNWATIIRAGEEIVRGAALPPIRDLSTKGILNVDDKAV